MKLYNNKGIAKRLGYHPNTLTLMKRWGLTFSHGMKTTEAHVLKWIEENPDFRVDKAQTLPPLGPRRGRRRSTAGRCDEPVHSHDSGNA